MFYSLVDVTNVAELPPKILSVDFVSAFCQSYVIIQSNCPKEFEPDVLNTSARRGFKNSTFANGMSQFFSLIKLKFLKANIPLNITSKQLKVLSITKFHKLFKCSQSIRVYDYAFSAQSRILFRTNVGNNVNRGRSIVV